MRPNHALRPLMSNDHAPRARESRPGRGWAPCGATLGALLLAATLAMTPRAFAQSLQNAATGSNGGVALQGGQATVTLNRILIPGVASVAEIAPNQVAAG